MNIIDARYPVKSFTTCLLSLAPVGRNCGGKQGVRKPWKEANVGRLDQSGMVDFPAAGPVRLRDASLAETVESPPG